MSNKAIDWAKKIHLPVGEKLFLMVLANSFNDKKGCCYPKIKTLAQWCSCSERSVKRYIKSLISKNIIQKEDVRNQFGHRITSRYTLNFDKKLNSLGDNSGCGKLISLGDNLSSLGDSLSIPKCQTVTKDYILNQNIKPKEKHDFSFVDNFEQTKQPTKHQKIQTLLSIEFEHLKSIYDDNYNIENSRRLFFKICTEKKHPVQFAKNLVKIRESQINYFKDQTNNNKLMPAQCSLFNWLDGERWLDGKIKPLGIKKKENTYVKCKICGEDYLKNCNCKRCEELKKPRVCYGQ